MVKIRSQERKRKKRQESLIRFLNGPEVDWLEGYAEKVSMRKKIKAHEQSKVKGSSNHWIPMVMLCHISIGQRTK
ncbi:CFC_HP_G0089360.mRNA.1.CDS.1 [Saccharomyces cerevisiae]|nr:CFC_HP_G0089360.mRNA.1.CDS.1 [Saccharomyces cerevisiae]CAI6838191.1 CFC_HP_G0089360.mRNA.1.CDS.1 [Saccharomyces cerevisiae]